MSSCMLVMISVGLAPSSTLEVMVMTRLRSLRFTALNVVDRLAVATALMGTSLIWPSLWLRKITFWFIKASLLWRYASAKRTLMG